MNSKSKVILRSVKDGAVAERVRECMDLCEWESIVKPGAKVVVKPNLCTAVHDKWEMSNTDPRITEAVCKVLLEKTPNVTIVESSGLRQTAWEAFEVSGHTALAKKLGVGLVNMTESKWRPAKVDPVGEIDLPEIMLDADVFITLPVLKTHALTYFTGAIKNQWGCVPHYNRILWHQHLNMMLASLHGIFRPAMAVMDGIIAMEGRGPANGKPRRLDLILASRDSVALDSSAARLVGLDPNRAEHILLAEKLGLGTSQPNQIELDGDWDKHKTQFEPAILDKAIAAMDYMTRYPWFVKYMLEKDVVFYPIRACVKMLRAVGVVEGGG
jgi:uncharacterized protein (DUF362 family)